MLRNLRSQEGTTSEARRPPACTWHAEIDEFARALRIWRGGTRRIGCVALTSPGGAGTRVAMDLASALPESEGQDWACGRARERTGSPLEPLAEVLATLASLAKERAASGDSAWEAYWDWMLVDLAPTLRGILPAFEWGRPVGRAPALRPRLARGRLLDAIIRAILRHASLRPVVIALDAFDRADPATVEAIGRLLAAPELFMRRPEFQAHVMIIASWASDGTKGDDLRGRLAPFREIHLSGATRGEWEGWWRRKRESLHPGSLRILQALAILEQPSSPARIASILGLAEAETIAEIEALAAESWLRVCPNGACGLGDRVASEVILNSLRPEDRRSLAGACAWSLLATAAEDHSPFASLPHLAEGGSWALYQAHARRACAKAEDLGVPELGIDAAGRIIETFRASGQPVPIEDVETYARLLEASGRGDDAVRTFEEWLRGTDAAPAARGRAFRRLADLYGRVGERRRQLACLDRGLEALADESESVERLAIFAELAGLGLADADLGGSLRWCEVGIDLAEIGALDQDEEFREILRITHEVHFRRGDYVEAENFEKRRLRAARKGNDAMATIESLDGLSGLSIAKGDIDVAHSWAVRALDVATETGSRYLAARALVRLARIRARAGAEEEALGALERAQVVLRELREDEDRAGVCDAIAVLSLVRGAYDRAASMLRESVRLRPRQGIGPSEGPFPASGERSAQDRRAEIRYHESELRRAVLRGAGPKEAATRLVLGDLHIEAGELDEACAMYLAGSRVREVLGDASHRALFLVRLARAARFRGREAQAMAYLTEALSHVAEDDARGMVSGAYIEAALLFLRGGEFSKSLRYLARALEMGRDEGDPAGSIEAILGVARFLTEIGRFRSGAVAALAAIEAAEKHDLCAGAMRAHIAAACAFRLAGSLEESAAHREAAASIGSSLTPKRELVELRLESAWAALAVARFETSVDDASAVLAEARAMGARDIEADALHVLGRLQATPQSPWHDFVRARDCLRRAMDLGEGRNLFVAEAECAMAALFQTRDSEGGSEQWVDRAAARLSRIIDSAPRAAGEGLRRRPGLAIAAERLAVATASGDDP